MKKISMIAMTVLLVMAAFTGMAQAAVISWVDWQNASPSLVTGNLVVGSNTIGVTYVGAYAFAQISGGINFWNPSAPYISASVDNAPPAYDIIALNSAGTKTITFSQTVQDPLMAFVSWNGNAAEFGVPIEILSYGTGYYGYGVPVLNAGGTGFSSTGEFHGVIRLPGSYDKITFRDSSNEYWHGITAGVTGLPLNNPVPEPATMMFMITGLAGIYARKRAIKHE